MDIESCNIASPPEPAPTTGEDRPAAEHLTAYDRLLARFGGRQAGLVRAIDRHQSTVAKWKSRGVPIEAAPAIVEGASRAGVALTLAELVEWIVADTKSAA